MTLIINLFGAPGAGKSTHRAKIFAEMKIAGYNVEEVTEYAKDVVWEERPTLFADQLYILAEQNRKLFRLTGKVDFVVTDSPLLMSIAYANRDVAYNPTLETLTVDVFSSYNNLNIFLNRSHDYQQFGRNQNEQEAEVLSTNIKQLLIDHSFHFSEYASDEFSMYKLGQQLQIHKKMLNAKEAVYNLSNNLK